MTPKFLLILETSLKGLGPGGSDIGESTLQSKTQLYLLASEVDQFSFRVASNVIEFLPMRSKR